MCATKKDTSLITYTTRRNTRTTGEPIGKRLPRTNGHLFVIQKHAASHLHYDFRITHRGALVSWAVPKGAPTKTSEKHLAIMTEDHPLSYATFEGVIPEGHYGAGTVMVWDKGSYKNVTTKNGKKLSLDACLDQGKLKLFLEGTKLCGTFALIRTKGVNDNWLFIKMHDTQKYKSSCPAKDRNKSVLTKRTMQQIKKDAQ